MCGHWTAKCQLPDFYQKMTVKRENNGFMTAIDLVPNNLCDLHGGTENDHFVAEMYVFLCDCSL